MGRSIANRVSVTSFLNCIKPNRINARENVAIVERGRIWCVVFARLVILHVVAMYVEMSICISTPHFVLGVDLCGKR